MVRNKSINVFFKTLIFVCRNEIQSMHENLNKRSRINIVEPEYQDPLIVQNSLDSSVRRFNRGTFCVGFSLAEASSMLVGMAQRDFAVPIPRRRGRRKYTSPVP